MSKVWRQTFRVWREDRERDERYQRLMQALGAFVDLPTLMGVPGVQPDAALLAMAQVWGGGEGLLVGGEGGTGMGTYAQGGWPYLSVLLLLLLPLLPAGSLPAPAPCTCRRSC